MAFGELWHGVEQYGHLRIENPSSIDLRSVGFQGMGYCCLFFAAKPKIDEPGGIGERKNGGEGSPIGAE